MRFIRKFHIILVVLLKMWIYNRYFITRRQKPGMRVFIFSEAYNCHHCFNQISTVHILPIFLFKYQILNHTRFCRMDKNNGILFEPTCTNAMTEKKIKTFNSQDVTSLLYKHIGSWCQIHMTHELLSHRKQWQNIWFDGGETVHSYNILFGLWTRKKYCDFFIIRILLTYALILNRI